MVQIDMEVKGLFVFDDASQDATAILIYSSDRRRNKKVLQDLPNVLRFWMDIRQTKYILWRYKTARCE